MQKQYVNVEQVIELDKAMWILREHIVRWGTRKNKFPSNANVNGSWMGEKERGIIGGEVKEVNMSTNYIWLCGTTEEVWI